MGFLLLPYLLPEQPPSGQSASYSLAYCTRFVVERSPLVSTDSLAAAEAPWTASIIITNVGPHAAALLGGNIVSKFRTGSESWPAPTGGRVLEPRKATSITLKLPVTTSGSDGPRVWEFRCAYRTRISSVYAWLEKLQSRLPRGLQADLPRVWNGQFEARYPENYDSVLTNDLGWRFKFVGRGPFGLYKDWRPAVEAATPFQRSFVESIFSQSAGQRVVIIALAPTTSERIRTNKASGMVTIRKEFAIYRGQLDGITEEGLRIRALATNESGVFETVEVRAADIQWCATGKNALEDDNAAFEQFVTARLLPPPPSGGFKPLGTPPKPRPPVNSKD
jgi:hypothetical protein